MLYNTTRKIAMRPRAGTHKRKCAVACVRIFKMMMWVPWPIVTAALQMVGARAIFGEACRRCGMQSHVTVAAAWDLLAQVISLVWVTHVGGADAWRPDVADFQQSSREPALDTLLFYEIAWYLACLVNTVVHRDPADRSTTLHHLISAVLVGVCQASNTTRVGVKMLRFFVYSTPVLHVARVLLHANTKRASDAVFVVFTATFFVTRVVAFPVLFMCPAWGLAMALYRDERPLLFAGGAVLIHAVYGLQLFWFWRIVRRLCKVVMASKM